MPEILGVPAEHVYVKRRERQRGTSQYQRLSKRRATGVVAENGLLFEVNFSDYLDTGLFLDHRDTRGWLRDLSSGKRFLNLFAYTGTATVYAAAGGATESVTVDLSSTYLAWARRNLALNELDAPAHTRVKADTLPWIKKAAAVGENYDLVFCDPPTFSNSKSMDGTWDIQRDHVSLLADLGELLAEEGLIVFSTNRRSFALDTAALSSAGLVAEEVTARTVPRDFERTPGVHRCWTLLRA
jgi:23S rRNA (guanine2445-N2)-methyltransferase / 23S rRNA (guanine2069-N7)-methyltransferase